MGWLTAWCAVGAVFVLGLISLGPLLELPALIGAIVLLTNSKARGAADLCSLAQGSSASWSHRCTEAGPAT